MEYILFSEHRGLFYQSGVAADSPAEAWAKGIKKLVVYQKPVGVYPKDQGVAEGLVFVRPLFDEWIEANKHKFFTGETRNPADIQGSPITPGPRKPKPVVCPEVWHTKPEVDTTDYMAAVRAMCGDMKP
jgi:hypothetical protein